MPAAEDAIEIFGPYRGAEADRFVEALQPFVDRTGAEIRYVGSVDFVDDLRKRVEAAGDPPDVAVVPQPGLVRALAEARDIVPLTRAASDELLANYPPAIAQVAKIDGAPYAVPFRITVKSLVWYRPDVFAEHGWTPPKTLAELTKLVRRSARDGTTPWCFTMSAGSATGWAATDWTEDLVLRSAGDDVYRRWSLGEINFEDPRIEAAFDEFGGLVLSSGHVAGGLPSVLGTPVEDAADPLFDDPPGCALYKQADFASAWMPEGTSIGPDRDVNWFVLPDVDASGGAPIVLGGDSIVQFRNTERIDALMAYLAGPDAGISWVREGGFLSPKASIPEDDYPDDYIKALVSAVAEAPVLAFDASDLMAPDIGSGLLWRAISEWVAGTKDYATLAAELDAAREAEDVRSARG